MVIKLSGHRSPVPLIVAARSLSVLAPPISQWAKAYRGLFVGDALPFTALSCYIGRLSFKLLSNSRSNSSSFSLVGRDKGNKMPCGRFDEDVISGW